MAARHQAERGQHRIAAADAGHAMKNARGTSGSRRLLQRRSGIGDGDEMPRRACRRRPRRRRAWQKNNPSARSARVVVPDLLDTMNSVLAEIDAALERRDLRPGRWNRAHAAAESPALSRTSPPALRGRGSIRPCQSRTSVKSVARTSLGEGLQSRRHRGRLLDDVEPAEPLRLRPLPVHSDLSCCHSRRILPRARHSSAISSTAAASGGAERESSAHRLCCRGRARFLATARH